MEDDSMTRLGRIRAFSFVFLLAQPAVSAALVQIDRRAAGLQRSRPADVTLETAARDLSDKAQDLRNVTINNPSANTVELNMAIGALAGSALAYSRAVAERRSDEELRSGAVRLIHQMQEIDTLLLEQRRNLPDLWPTVQDHAVRVSDFYSLGYTVSRGRTESGGLLRWRGRVDGTEHVILRGNQVTVRHLAHQPVSDASYNLSAPLPRRGVNVRLHKVRGRGRVELLQQPSSFNRYSATVLIDDTEAGADFYEIELSW
jgi:hypothetical protein